MAYYGRSSVFRERALRRRNHGLDLLGVLLAALAFGAVFLYGRQQFGVDLSVINRGFETFGFIATGSRPAHVQSGYNPEAATKVEVAGARVAAASPSAPAQAAPATTAAPYCAAGQAPAFVLGLATLRERVGDAMGSPVDCEHANAANGDVLQTTSTGLAVFEASTGTLRFTNGWQHWALLPDGRFVEWEGASTEPPR